VIAAPNRDGLRQYLKNQGVGTEVYYPVPLHRQECLAFLGYQDGAFPVAEQACRDLLALPIYPELTEQQQEFVVQHIQEFYQR
jgi:dTDP-4-amino-4,6-dideoxygalactose transaminase